MDDLDRKAKEWTGISLFSLFLSLSLFLPSFLPSFPLSFVPLSSSLFKPPILPLYTAFPKSFSNITSENGCRLQVKLTFLLFMIALTLLLRRVRVGKRGAGLGFMAGEQGKGWGGRMRLWVKGNCRVRVSWCKRGRK